MKDFDQAGESFYRAQAGVKNPQQQRQEQKQEHAADPVQDGNETGQGELYLVQREMLWAFFIHHAGSQKR